MMMSVHASIGNVIPVRERHARIRMRSAASFAGDTRARRRGRPPDVKYHLTPSRQGVMFRIVIRRFRAKTLKVFFETGDPSGLSVPNVARVRRILLALDAASEPQQVNVPGYFFHGLRGERRWSIRVSGNWRITFGWDAADAIDVDLEDYH